MGLGIYMILNVCTIEQRSRCTFTYITCATIVAALLESQTLKWYDYDMSVLYYMTGAIVCIVYCLHR